jgi:hypothetical protein
MTERDFRNFKRLIYWLPVITLAASLLTQWGSWQANSANIQNQFAQQKSEYEKRFEQIEREKADADVIESKFDAIDWKLNLIMKNLGVDYIKRTNRDSI